MSIQLNESAKIYKVDYNYFFLQTFYQIYTIYKLLTRQNSNIYSHEFKKMLKKKTIKKKYVPNSKEKYMCAKHKNTSLMS